MRRWDVPGTARYLTFSCYRGLRLFDNDKIKNRFADLLSIASERHAVRVLAWVVMPEHVHLTVFPEKQASIVTFLSVLKGGLAREVINHWQTVNAPILPRLRDRQGAFHFWQAGGGYDRHAVGVEVIEKIRYIHANPIRRGLSIDSVSWKWSSARKYRGLADAIGPDIALELVPSHDGELS